MTVYRWTLSLLTVLLGAACSNPLPAPASPGGPTAPLDATQQQVAASSNDFSFALFQQLAKSEANKNVVVSPLSASMSLGMTMNGAAGTTFDAMRNALRLGTTDMGTLDAAYRGLIDRLRQTDATTTFQIANSIWYRAGFPFRQSFLDTTKKYFDAAVQGLDFANQAASLATINAWVNANTGGRIPTILDQITNDQVMFLINAIYFKGTWQVQFDPKSTRPSQFIADDGTVQTVPFMNRPEHLKPLFKVGGYRNLAIAEVPYGNGSFVMDLILRPFVAKPNIDSIAATFTPAIFDSLAASLKDADYALAMPKFTISYERVLNPELAALGMGIAFTDAANFSGMSPQSLELEFVKQKTWIDVNEQGTEAGASTVTGVQLTSLSEFRVDRPFIFIIRERQSGAIVFMGKVLRIP